MDFQKFEPILGSWGRVLKPFIESKECDNIYATLKDCSLNGKKIAPLSINTWKAFQECDYNNLKVVCVGMCPYHTFKNGTPVADGKMMSCSITNTLQPSLEILYKGIEEDIADGMDLTMQKPADLNYLSLQGVLLLNAALTTEENKAGSHIDLWKPFMNYMFKEVFNKYNRGLVFIFFGKDAGKYEKLLTPMLHYSKVIEHPAAASYTGKEWKHDNVFSWTNNILKSNLGEEVHWINSEPPW
jgi:uracil-DNA glycosylase